MKISKSAARAGLLALALPVVAGLAPVDAFARPSDRFSAPYAAPASPVPSFDDLRKRAEAGSADAQFDLGLAYQLGLGTKRDLAAARQWFGKAAAQNHARAQAGLGFLLLSGQGGPVDLPGAEKALRAAGDQGEASAWANLAELALASGPGRQAEAIALLERAVGAGAVNARYRLGRLLIEGEMVAADAPRGLGLLEQAAAQGHPYSQAYLAYLIFEGQAGATEYARGFGLAQRAANADLAEGANELGRYYLMGIATKRDPKQAAKWFGRAGELGEPNGWYNLALLQESGDLGKPDLAEARKLAIRAAGRGHLLAAGMAGRMLYRAEGGPRDRAGAYPYLKTLAEEGVADAQNMLASLLMSGDGAPANPVAAMDWWEKAALQGHGAAVNNFTTYLAMGRGRKADPARARQLLAAQAAKDYAPSQFRWAMWQEQGWQGTPRDLKAALDWYRRAAENGHAAAAFKYASYLEAGEGMPADLAAALRWYRAGAERGNAPAQFQLARLLFNGEGGPADPAAAARWLERSAGQGYPEALFVLGDQAWRGEGRPADPALAWAYLRLAEDAGVAEAADNRRFVESRLSPPERDKAVATATRLAGAIRREKEDE